MKEQDRMQEKVLELSLVFRESQHPVQYQYALDTEDSKSFDHLMPSYQVKRSSRSSRSSRSRRSRRKTTGRRRKREIIQT